jgi:hypothetical protein
MSAALRLRGRELVRVPRRRAARSDTNITLGQKIYSARRVSRLAIRHGN